MPPFHLLIIVIFPIFNLINQFVFTTNIITLVENEIQYMYEQFAPNFINIGRE